MKNMEKSLNITTENNLAKVSKEIVSILKETGITIITLSGDLGAGKTTLTRYLAKDFGFKDTVSSPTFVIQKQYIKKSHNSLFEKILHIDLYRLNAVDEIIEIGLLEFEKENLYIIEWPEMIEEILANKKHLKIKIAHEEDNSRKFTMATNME